jgi:hypothetical protein
MAPTATTDEIERRFEEGFEAAAALYREENPQECAEAARQLLDDPAIPRY